KQEEKLEQVERQVEALKIGTRSTDVIRSVFAGETPFDVEAEGGMPSLDYWNHRLQAMSRSRGRVWRGVTRASDVDQANSRVRVNVPAPQPHGIEEGAILYAFEVGPPNGANPTQGRQYLGEFRVAEAGPAGVTLESTHRLNARTGKRLENSQGEWRLYETMPADRHDLFAGVGEEQLRDWLPSAAVEEYLRHGGPVTADDDPSRRASFDDKGLRVGPEDLAAASGVEERYDRPLREYAFLFDMLWRQYAVRVATLAALKEDIAQLDEAGKAALELTSYREQERDALQRDLQNVQRERQFIRAHLSAVTERLEKFNAAISALLAKNVQLAEQIDM
ncbi:MAG: hypothetical protein AAF961_09900, partial [Planctomycetota bacterium]